MMKVLILCPFFRPNLGGVETHLTDLTEYLRKRNHRVFVTTYTPITTDVKAPSRERKWNLDVHRLKWFGNGLFFSLEPYPILELLYLFFPLFAYSFLFLCKQKVEVINAHGLVAAFITKILSKIFRTRSVMSVHVVYNFEKRPALRLFTRWVVSSFDEILVLSKRSKMDFLGLGLPENKISIYTHWVDQTVFKPLPNREELRDKFGFADHFVVLFVSGLYPSKGIFTLLDVAKNMPSQVRLVFIGSGSLQSVLKNAAAEDRNIDFAGRVSLKQLVEYYSVADVFIIPSVHAGSLKGYHYEEGFARVVVESLSCGTPVIVSNVGCLPDTIDMSVGRVLNPTSEEIGRQILHFLNNPEELEKLRSKCREYALERFSEKNANIIERSIQGKDENILELRATIDGHEHPG